MTLTKAAMAEMLFDEFGLNKRESKEMVEGFFEEIKLALETGHDVKLSGFGNFRSQSKAVRPGRNPKTGEKVAISARKVARFRPRQKLKMRVEAYVGNGK
jgi:integration host factor subunit alpha